MELNTLHSDILMEILVKMVDGDWNNKLENCKWLLMVGEVNKRFNQIINKIWLRLWKKNMDDECGRGGVVADGDRNGCGGGNDVVGDRNNRGKKYITNLKKLTRYESKVEQFLCACRIGCLKLINHFLNMIPIEIYRQKMINIFASFGHLNCLKEFINDKINKTGPFLLAITGDHLHIIKYFMSLGFDLFPLYFEKYLMLCCHRNGTKTARYILENYKIGDINIYLKNAVNKKSIDMMRLLIEYEANKNLIPKDKRKEYLNKQKPKVNVCNFLMEGRRCKRKTTKEFCFQHSSK